MKRYVQDAILVTVGGIAMTTAWRGLYLNFVKPGLKWWLITAGAVVVVMGIYGMWTDDQVPAETGQDEAANLGVNEAENLGVHETENPGGHEAHHGPRIGWLLLFPFLVLSLIVPAPLGAFSAERDSGALRSAPPPPDTWLPPLRATGGPVTMSLSEYSERAVFEKGKSLAAHRVRLVGFVSRRAGRTGPGWYLTRMAVSCCAADGYAIKIDVRGGDRRRSDTWVAVTGFWVMSAGNVNDSGTLAALQIESTQTVATPARPYEY